MKVRERLQYLLLNSFERDWKVIEREGQREEENMKKGVACRDAAKGVAVVVAEEEYNPEAAMDGGAL